MNNETSQKTATKEKERKVVSPRVDGKRPRIKPTAQNVDEHVKQEEGSTVTSDRSGDSYAGEQGH